MIVIAIGEYKEIVIKASHVFFHYQMISTRKYPFSRYILGVLTYKIAWEQNWGGDETPN